MSSEQEPALISAQFPSELRERIARSAQAHDRSFSAELREAARAYLGGQEASPQAPLEAAGSRGAAMTPAASGAQES
jgi:plasmid stability protein